MPPRRSTHPDNLEPDDLNFEQLLQEAEHSLLALKDRYAQVQTDQQRQQALQQRQRDLQRQVNGQGRHKSDRSPSLQAELRAELKNVQQQLEELEIALESQLFSWGGLKDVFWQAVRFGGVGIVIGWILKTLAG
jgi:hypothetical protein